jgi:hypothetical protein
MNIIIPIVVVVARNATQASNWFLLPCIKLQVNKNYNI